MLHSFIIYSFHILLKIIEMEINVKFFNWALWRRNLQIKIKNKLQYSFHIVELESSRAGKIGMEVGSTRERILIALLISKFGEENVETQIW